MVDKYTEHRCTCGEMHVISPPHKETMNKMKLVMLKRAAAHVMETHDNNFMVREIADDDEFKLFNNFQKLRYHGLITPVRDNNNKRIKGQWLITRNGWAFLKGQKDLPKYVLVKDNHIVERSTERVTLRNVAADPMEIIRTFEYFDENMLFTGLRPALA